MKTKFLSFIHLFTCLCSPAGAQTPFDVDAELDYCHRQVLRALDCLEPLDYNAAPRNILSSDGTDGACWNLRPVSGQEWCSGFWPGILWMDYEVSGDRRVKKAASGYTRALAAVLDQPVFDHDLGFLIHCSYGKGYEATERRDYLRTILRASDSLATLYRPKVGTILSWPRHVQDYGGHNTIMDNMMNLDMLLWAADHGGSPRLRDIAMAHAATTMRHHFRLDGSSYHVAVYDESDGHFLRGMTHQGYADSSMWARGQAWAIYGFTMMHRYTGDEAFLAFAQRVADIYLKRLHETSDDRVPLWDMDDPRGARQSHPEINPAMDRRAYAPKDASAACIVASALLELSQYVSSYDDTQRYHDEAVGMLTDLSAHYRSNEANVAFLMHSTGHHPAGSEIDASIIYADYYYLEALLRLRAKNLQRR